MVLAWTGARIHAKSAVVRYCLLNLSYIQFTISTKEYNHKHRLLVYRQRICSPPTACRVYHRTPLLSRTGCGRSYRQLICSARNRNMLQIRPENVQLQKSIGNIIILCQSCKGDRAVSANSDRNNENDKLEQPSRAAKFLIKIKHIIFRPDPVILYSIHSCHVIKTLVHFHINDHHLQK